MQTANSTALESRLCAKLRELAATGSQNHSRHAVCPAHWQPLRSKAQYCYHSPAHAHPILKMSSSAAHSLKARPTATHFARAVGWDRRRCGARQERKRYEGATHIERTAQNHGLRRQRAGGRAEHAPEGSLRVVRARVRIESRT